MQTTPYDSPGTLSFLMPKIDRRNSDGVTTNGATNKGVDFLSISRYISKTVQASDIVTMKN